MSSTSAAPPPGGDENIGYKLVIVATTTIATGAITILLRMYVRARIVRAVGWDDWLMLLALVLGVVATGAELKAVALGFGRHAYYLTPSQRYNIMMWASVSSTHCIMALCVGKISLCISLLRIIQGAGWRKLRWIIYITMFVVFAVNTVVAITNYVQCNPVQKNWNPAIPGTCWKPSVQLSLTYFRGAVSAFTDFEISLLPIAVFQKLQITRRSKLILSGLMGIGCFTGIMVIVRLYYIGPYAQMGDGSYTNVNTLIWAAGERNIAIIAASVPFIRPILRLVPKFKKPWVKESQIGIVKNEKSQDVSELSGTSHNRGFESYNASVGKTESAASILPEHSSNGVWRTTQISSFESPV